MLHHLKWAMSLEQVSAEAKLIAIYLANYADQDGWIEVSVAKIAQWACTKPRTIRTEIQYLNLDFWADAGFNFFRVRIPEEPGNGGSWALHKVEIDIFKGAAEIIAKARPPALFTDWPADYADKFWSLYPNKKSKAHAMKALDKIAKAGKTRFVDLIAGVERYILSRDVQRGFVKHPATWLNGECWNDQEQTTPIPVERPKSFLEAAMDFDDGTGTDHGQHA